MSLIKKPYEISVWEDVIVYVGVSGAEYSSISEMSEAVKYQYYTERELAIIGSSTMTSPARTINNVFKKNINGLRTLTFDMYYQYEDLEQGKVVRNPLIDLVIDERKVKLHYDNEWYDFIVKKDDEKGRDYKYSFTCTDLAINELGKTGFNIELDAELGNNMGTVQELALEVLRDSDWLLARETGDIIQLTNEEALYSLILTSPITNVQKLDDSNFNDIPENARIYAYYTPYVNLETNYFLFIYVLGDTGSSIPDLLEDKVTINCNNTRTYDLYTSNVKWVNDRPNFVNNSSEVKVSLYRGLRYVRKLSSIYDPVLKLTVLEYTGKNDNKTYYGYTTTEYIDSTTVENYIYNSTNFSGTSYWSIHGANDVKSIVARVFPGVDTNNTSLTRAGYLVAKFGGVPVEDPPLPPIKLVNDGILLNYSRINRFDKGDVYRLKISIGTISNNSYVVPNSIPINCLIRKYDLVDSDSNITVYFDSSNATVTKSGEYFIIDMICSLAATWESLKKNVGIFFFLKDGSDVNAEYYIKDVLFYRKVMGDNNHVLEPGETPTARIKTLYHFYNLDLVGKSSPEDYEYAESDSSSYTPVFGSGNKAFEKVRSITEKESNRFNLLLTLSETFECWVKFKIEHETNGLIKTETFPYYNPVNLTSGPITDYYIYDWSIKNYRPATGDYNSNLVYYKLEFRTRLIKKVIFYQERLVDNYAGFKYGINLKDNNRTLDSELIVTKIIVKDNSCEAAENGFCSIARAEDNPTKENFAYNFDYYTSQGIISLGDLNNDLYLLGVGGSIGLYPRLAKLNKKRNELISSAAPLANSISDLSSKYLVATLTYHEAEKDLWRMKDPQSGTIYQYTHYVFDDFYNLIGRKANNLNVPSYPNEIYYINKTGVSNITTNSGAGALAYYKVTNDTSPVSGKTYYYISESKFTKLNNNKFRDECVYYEKINFNTTTLTSANFELGGYTLVDGQETLWNTDYRIHSDYIPVFPGLTYTISTDIYYLIIREYEAKSSESYVAAASKTQEGGVVYSFTVPSGINYIKILLGKSTEYSGDNAIKIYPADVTSVTIEPSTNFKYTANTYFLTGSNTTKLNFTVSSGTSPEVYIYNAARRRMDNLGAEDFINDNFTISTLEKIITLSNNKNTAAVDMEKYLTDLNATLALYDSILDLLKEIARATDEIEREFNIKYARYILEGSWTDDNYMDDDLYYLDALAVLYLSAYPKVSYNFKVIDLSLLEGYELYKFDIGYKTYVEDTEFFGYWTIDGLPTPVKELVVVTEATLNLDEPEKNDLKVQNYKTHFEDLFQRITAATQSLEYHSGEYGRAAAAISPDGTVTESVMQRSLATAAYIIQNSHDLSVVWDDTGILATNLSDPAQITRLASAGLLVSADGGKTWGVAISGYGINTNYLTAGLIDADKINIMSGAYPTFKWDGLGLRAYGFTTDDNGIITSYDPSRYVVYDRFGIYGVNGLTNANFLDLVEVKNNAIFGLTWNGLFIKSLHRDGYVSIDSLNDITLREYFDNNGIRLERIRGKFGLISPPNATEDIYGLALYAEDGTPTVETKSTGTLWLKSLMDIGVPTGTTTYIGVGQEATAEEMEILKNIDHGKKVISVHGAEDSEYQSGGEYNIDRFTVFEDGFVLGHGEMQLAGVDFPSGTIGSLSISEIPKTLGIRIIQNDGDTFRLDETGEGTPWALSFNRETSFKVVDSTTWKFGYKPSTTSEPYTMDIIPSDEENNIILYYYTNSTKTDIGYNKVVLSENAFNANKTRYYIYNSSTSKYVHCTSSSSYVPGGDYYIKISEIFSGGLAYLRCEVLSEGKTYQSQISIKLERDGRSADAYTYYLESSEGYIINTNETTGNTTLLTASFYKNGEKVNWSGHTIHWYYKKDDNETFLAADLKNADYSEPDYLFKRVRSDLTHDYMVILNYLNLNSIQIYFVVDEEAST